MPVKLATGRALAMLSLTSLIDVVFLLLIFFLVATKFAEEDEDKSLDVQLPSASEALPITSKAQEIRVGIDERGRFFIKGNEMTLNEMEAYLRQAAINNPVGSEVSVEADKRADIQSAVHVFNACNKAGIGSYKIKTSD